ncbi:hypothetical protein I5U90_03320 [Stenotrophomonas maltophilia]|nr:hypothetical protein [Stenotrophomonas maltophilia]
MTTDNKTLADVQPGGRVRLGDQLRSELLDQAERLERMAAQDRETGESIEQALEAGEEYTPDDAPDVAAGLQHDANRSEEIAALLRKAAAALSAQPSPGGQDALRVIAERLRGAGASLPAPPITGTIEGSMVTGLSIALALVEEALAARQPVTMDDALAAGDGTLQGAIDHWQERALRAEDELAARQPVEEPVGTVHSGKYASGMPWCEVEWHIPQPAGTKLYTAQAAQAVDLGQFVPDPKTVPDCFAEDDSDAQYNSGWNDCRNAVLALIDSQGAR